MLLLPLGCIIDATRHNSLSKGERSLFILRKNRENRPEVIRTGVRITTVGRILESEEIAPRMSINAS